MYPEVVPRDHRHAVAGPAMRITVNHYQAFRVELMNQVARVSINRPDKLNAMNATFWTEIREVFGWADETDEVRVVVLDGAGSHFSTGIDLALLASVASQQGVDVGRNAERLRRQILDLQTSLAAVERCRKPVIAAIHGYCLGGAIDLIAVCDMRYSTEDAQFAIKEVDMGMTADLGTLQRLPGIIGEGMLRELAYSARTFDGAEAQRIGLVNRTYADQSQMLEGVLALAAQIAAKSPLAIRGTKQMIRYMRDHSVSDGLDYVATWNAAMLQSTDLSVAMAAHMARQKPDFAD